MSDMGSLRVTIVETNLPELQLITTTYDQAAGELRSRGFEVIYESRTGVLTSLQRELYKKVVSEASKEIAVLLDPIIASFAIRDACDLSGIDYVWLDLEGDDEIGNSAWTRKGEGGQEIIRLATRLLERHLEKYIIDAYDRQTRDDMASVWDAQFKLQACPVCGGLSLKREPVVLNKRKLRAWVCSECGHHVMVQGDVLNFLMSKL
jgi:hypothetical protein